MKKIWNQINWSQVESKVYDLQSKIFQTSRKEQSFSMKIETRKLQKELVNLQESKLLSIRRVVDDNSNASIRLTDQQKIELLSKLHLNGKSNLIQTSIKTTNFSKTTISIIEDKIKQLLVLSALEPEWEAVFETNSYGGRPGYSIADVKWLITRQIQGGPKFVLIVDLQKALFETDNVYLLKKLNQSRMISMQIKNWLKAGILNNLHNDEIIRESSLNNLDVDILFYFLVNISLHGLEHNIKADLNEKVKFIRYLNKFLILGKDLENIKQAQLIVEKFLKLIGLDLLKTQMSICHTLEKTENYDSGFHFLGFFFRNIKCSIHRGVKSTRGVKQPFKQQCIPSKKSIEYHKIYIKNLLKKYKNASLKLIIYQLNEKIREWTNYFSISQSTKTFSKLDGWLFKLLWKWSLKRYKSAKNAKKKCWSVSGWKFGFKIKNQTFVLIRHDQTRVHKHLKIQSNASIYDNQLVYFAKRIPLTNSRIKQFSGLLKKQGYKCSNCNNLFKPTDTIKICNVVNKVFNTKTLTLLHNFCYTSDNRFPIAN